MEIIKSGYRFNITPCNDDILINVNDVDCVSYRIHFYQDGQTGSCLYSSRIWADGTATPETTDTVQTFPHHVNVERVVDFLLESDFPRLKKFLKPHEAYCRHRAGVNDELMDQLIDAAKPKVTEYVNSIIVKALAEGGTINLQKCEIINTLNFDYSLLPTNLILRYSGNAVGIIDYASAFDSSIAWFAFDIIKKQFCQWSSDDRGIYVGGEIFFKNSPAAMRIIGNNRFNPRPEDFDNLEIDYVVEARQHYNR